MGENSREVELEFPTHGLTICRPTTKYAWNKVFYPPLLPSHLAHDHAIPPLDLLYDMAITSGKFHFRIGHRYEFNPVVHNSISLRESRIPLARRNRPPQHEIHGPRYCLPSPSKHLTSRNRRDSLSINSAPYLEPSPARATVLMY